MSLVAGLSDYQSRWDATSRIGAALASVSMGAVSHDDINSYRKSRKAGKGRARSLGSAVRHNIARKGVSGASGGAVSIYDVDRYRKGRRKGGKRGGIKNALLNKNLMSYAAPALAMIPGVGIPAALAATGAARLLLPEISINDIRRFAGQDVDRPDSYLDEEEVGDEAEGTEETADEMDSPPEIGPNTTPEDLNKMQAAKLKGRKAKDKAKGKKDGKKNKGKDKDKKDGKKSKGGNKLKTPSGKKGKGKKDAGLPGKGGKGKKEGKKGKDGQGGGKGKGKKGKGKKGKGKKNKSKKDGSKDAMGGGAEGIDLMDMIRSRLDAFFAAAIVNIQAVPTWLAAVGLMFLRTAASYPPLRSTRLGEIRYTAKTPFGMVPNAKKMRPYTFMPIVGVIFSGLLLAALSIQFILLFLLMMIPFIVSVMAIEFLKSMFPDYLITLFSIIT